MLEGEVLHAAFGKAAPEHYAWQTAAPGVAEHERALVNRAFRPLGSRLLDLGCGEGATLLHLGEPSGAVGVDLFPEKIAFAQRTLPKCQFICASVYELPFEDGSFDHLVIRDLIHHLDDPERFIAEATRVLSPGGRIDVLEPCRYNPLIFAQAVTVPAERGELRSTTRYLSQLILPHARILEREALQAFPLHRLVFHPQFGRPGWGRAGLVQRLVAAVENVAERVIPRWAWAYIHIRAEKK